MANSSVSGLPRPGAMPRRAASRAVAAEDRAGSRPEAFPKRPAQCESSSGSAAKIASCSVWTPCRVSSAVTPKSPTRLSPVSGLRAVCRVCGGGSSMHAHCRRARQARQALWPAGHSLRLACQLRVGACQLTACRPGASMQRDARRAKEEGRTSTSCEGAASAGGSEQQVPGGNCCTTHTLGGFHENEKPGPAQTPSWQRRLLGGFWKTRCFRRPKSPPAVCAASRFPRPTTQRLVV